MMILYLARFFLQWNMFQTNVVEKNRADILRAIKFFEKLFHLWDNVEKYCIPKATNTHSVYVIRIIFPLQQWLHERASLLRDTYTACLVKP